MANSQVETRLNEMKEYIRTIYMRNAYNVMRPTEWEQEDEDWWNDTFMFEAVNSNHFSFEEEWNEYVYGTNNEDPADAFVIIGMINAINNWSDEIIGEHWKYGIGNLTYEKVFQNFAYFYVLSEGVDFWREQKDKYNEYVATMDEAEEESDAESVEEEYTGSKDFPPNETDDNCPICLEAYTPQKQRDGIRNSDEHKSKCPHYCCVPCWLELYDKNEGEKKRCPICRANITKWLDDNHIGHLGDYP